MAFAAIFVIASVIFSFRIKKTSEITKIEPSTGSAGDLITITGKNFGNTRDTSYIEIGGSRMTNSSYISWKDTEIRLILPPNFQDGLVYAGIKGKRSKSAYFASSNAAPIVVSSSHFSSTPIITSITPEKIYPGSLITIKGSNFGNTKENSEVYFSVDRIAGDGSAQFVTCNEDDFDYVSWNDSEITLHVPESAKEGDIYIETAKGKSLLRKLPIDRKAGTKSFMNPKTYILMLGQTIEDQDSDKDSTVIFRVPRPIVYGNQPIVNLTECEPESSLKDFQHTLIHQSQNLGKGITRRSFQETFEVIVYEVRTSVVSIRTGKMDTIQKQLFQNTTKEDKLLPSTNEDIKKLCNKIVGKETNECVIASLVYNYLIDNFSIIKDSKLTTPVDTVSKKKGDAYDFALLYATLLRAKGIPCVVDSGLLVGSDLKTQNHWWNEFYAPLFGWIPVDVSLGAGMEFLAMDRQEKARDFYFGNLDNQHIIFTHGPKEIKPSSPDNKVKTFEKSFAMQSIWEEASGKNVKYNSTWDNPSIIGVY